MMTLLYASAFAFGAWALQQQAVLPSGSAALTLVPLLLLSGFVAVRGDRRSAAIARLLWILTWALGGFLWAGAFAAWRLSDSLPDIWEGRDIPVLGVVAEMPQPEARYTRFVFDIERAMKPAAQVPRRVLLNWYSDPVSGEPAPVHAGQRWALTVRLRKPHGNANSFGFQREPWLLERGIRATGYVRPQEPARLLASRVWRPGYLLEALRERVRQRLQGALAGRTYGGIVVALAVGDQHAISRDQWTVLTRAGVNHLMSISGLHITMVSALAFLLARRLWRLVPQNGRVPARHVATAVGLLAAIGYAALSGFAVPAQRTVYMLAAVAVALWSGWRWPPAAVLGVALFGVIAVAPMAVLSPGFWLSFGAIAAILLAGSGSGGRTGPVLRWARVQWAVTIALVPLTLAMFQQVSVVSPLANAVAIPLVSLCVAPLALLAIAVPWDWIAIAAHGVMSGCMLVLEWLVSWPAAVWQQHAPLWWSVPMALLGAAWLLMPKGFPSRWAGAVLLLPMFLARPPMPGAGDLWFTVLDVGQGLAVVARTREHVLLFDAGPDFGEGSDAGERIVVPNLRGAGIAHIDALIVSHDDTDHAGGAGSVLAALPVARVLTSSPNLLAAATAPPAQRCAAGQRWHWDGVEFEMLHPTHDSYNLPAIRDNDRSCVLHIVSAYGSVLIPGDIEVRSERELIAAGAPRLASDVLIAPHHGSNTSSSLAFLSAVGAKRVIVPAGYRNRFGHPHPAVAARYRAVGATMLRTDLDGAVSARFNAGGIEIEVQRDRKPRYWQER